MSEYFSDRGTEHPDVPLPGPIHTTQIPVRWTDFDRFAHMNNAAYIELAQEARLVFAYDNFMKQGYEIPTVFVRRIDADYLAPVLPDTQNVTIDTQVIAIGHTSFTTRQKIRDRHGKICAIVEVVQIAMDLNTATSRAITSKEIGVLTSGGDSSDSHD